MSKKKPVPLKRTQAAFLLLAAMLLGACAGLTEMTRNEPLTNGDPKIERSAIPHNDSDTLILFSFSGGGTRSAAFSYGVLKELKRTKTGKNEGALLDRIGLISGVSGGAVTAAWYVYGGPERLEEFPERFLYRNAEEDLTTNPLLPWEWPRLLAGGLNDRTVFADWLNRNVFEDATFGDVLKNPERPILIVQASDIFNRTPFLFEEHFFNSLCSNLKAYKIADAVAASAAVPGAFAPVLIKNYSEDCPRRAQPDSAPPMSETNPPKSEIFLSIRQTLRNYKYSPDQKYIKLLDGGLTDNVGVAPLTVAHQAPGNLYQPLDEEAAIKLKNIVIWAVNSSRAQTAEWSKTPEGPEGEDLVMAVSDTTINASMRMVYDAFSQYMKQWQDDLRKYRCALPKGKLKEIKARDPRWRCDGIIIHVSQISFQDLDESLQSAANGTPTRFVLPREQVDAMIEAGQIALGNNAVFRNLFARPPN